MWADFRNRAALASLLVVGLVTCAFADDILLDFVCRYDQKCNLVGGCEATEMVLEVSVSAANIGPPEGYTNRVNDQFGYVHEIDKNGLLRMRVLHNGPVEFVQVSASSLVGGKVDTVTMWPDLRSVYSAISLSEFGKENFIGVCRAGSCRRVFASNGDLTIDCEEVE